MKQKIAEKDIQKGIIEYLLWRGHFVYKSGTGSFRMSYKGKERFVRMGVKGLADIIGTHKEGRSIAIEVKVPGNKPTEDQLAFLAEVHGRNGIAFVATSVDDVIKEGL